MRVVVVACAALYGCYQAPTQDASCSILCKDTCPDEMACVNGYCVAEGDTCEPTFQRVHAGNGFACALDENRRRWCWGANEHHQIDASDETQIVYATLVDDTRWDSLATGGDHACGLRNGELYCWGGNDAQQVTGGVIGDVTQPTRIVSPRGGPWTFVATGYNSTCAISDRLYCWGAGDSGQLGTGSMTSVGIPTAVDSEITDWESVSLGRNHACAISRTGGLHCWGLNYYGEVGNNAPLYTATLVLAPTAIALPDTTSVAVAGYSTCAVAAGKLYCWGYPYQAVLGDPAVVDACGGARAAPTLASGLEGWTTVSASQFMSCALRGDEVWCWGFALGGGGLGQGVWNGNGWGRVTVGATDISLGWSANPDEQGDAQDVDLACVIIGGDVQCWGDNRYGQLAQGDATMHPTPHEIAGDYRWKQLQASDLHTCGVTMGDELYCWGTMLSGQTIGTTAGTDQLPCGAVPGVPCTLGEPTRVPFQPMAEEVGLGDNHTCAVFAGQMTCWGGNGSLQLGVPGGNETRATLPGSTWTRAYSVGSSASCGVKDGQTWCWGSFLLTNQPPTHEANLDGMRGAFTNATLGDAVRHGNARTLVCALETDGELACAGDNFLGQFGTGAPPTGFCGNFVCEPGETEALCLSDCAGTMVCNTDPCGTQTCMTAYDVCGDGRCNQVAGETCSSCAAECGACTYQSTGRTYTAFAMGMGTAQANVCGVRTDGRVECWARNQHGQAGVLDETTGRTVDPVYTPQILAGLDGCTAIGVGDGTTCAICNGDIYCWGSNRRGALGAGPLTAAPLTQPRKVDVQLEAGDRLVAITSGTGYSCARSEQGRGYCWGFHRYGALGTGASSANVPTPIKLAPGE